MKLSSRSVDQRRIVQRMEVKPAHQKDHDSNYLVRLIIEVLVAFVLLGGLCAVILFLNSLIPAGW